MLQRFNGLSATQLQGTAAEGESSGTAMARMQSIIGGVDGYRLEWSGLSYQEQLAAGQTLLVYLASVLFIFLCLAALYESWSIPLSVMLIIPLGIIGAVVAARLAGYENDIYFRVGMLTTIGLSAKNAILIVEFVETRLKAGSALLQATTGRGATASAAHRDDLIGVCRGCDPPGAFCRCRGRQPARNRDCGDRRHDFWHTADIIVRTVVFVLTKQGLARLKARK